MTTNFYLLLNSKTHISNYLPYNHLYYFTDISNLSRTVLAFPYPPNLPLSHLLMESLFPSPTFLGQKPQMYSLIFLFLSHFISNSSVRSLYFIFKIYLESSYFSSLPQLPPCSKPPLPPLSQQQISTQSPDLASCSLSSVEFILYTEA